MAGMTEDDKYFITADGKKIAKNGLSPGRRQSFADQIAQVTAPQMTPAPVAPAAPQLDLVAPPVPQTMDLANSGINPQMVAQANNPAPMPQALPQDDGIMLTDPSQFGAPVAAQGAPVAGMNASYATDLTPYNAPGPVSKSIEKSLIAGYDQRQRAVNEMVKIAGDREREQAEIKLQQQRALDNINAQMNQDAINKQNALATTEAQLSQTRDELANAKVDPDRFFGNDTGKRIMAGIAIAFGSIGQALTKANSNAALDIINNAIDRDIMAQKENIGTLKDKYAAQRQGLGDIYTKFGDVQNQRLAQKVITIEQVQSKLDQVASRYATPDAKAKALELNGGLEIQKADALFKLEQNAMANALKRAEAYRGAVQRDNKLMVNGIGIANTEDDAKQIKAGLEGKENLISKIDKMIALREKHGGGAILNRTDVQRGQQLASDALLAYKDVSKLGVLSEKDTAILNAIIPSDPLSYRDPLSAMSGEDPVLNKLKSFKLDIESDFRSKVGTRMQALDPAYVNAQKKPGDFQGQYGSLKVPGQAPRTQTAGK